ncbi:hypothetical protein AB0I61_34155 [Polymorphospora rubra]|uniref:hypothetical protein n=1 Tax=Polymorphospora rubra TaxID=338584 RepID=UPI0033C42746
MTYPETFDTFGPASLDESHAYLSWTAVSVHRVLEQHPETTWELLPSLLGQYWGDPDWYQRNEWLADFYNNVYHHAGTVEPAQIFAVDEMGQPAADLARIIDAVTQNWISAAYQATEPQEQGHDRVDPGEQAGATDRPGPDHDLGYDDPATAPEQDEPVAGQTGEGGHGQEPLTDLDPEVAREVLARVLDDEEDDLSPADQQILATVLSVEKFQYLAREYDLV